jgi:hypothetical protein
MTCVVTSPIEPATGGFFMCKKSGTNSKSIPPLHICWSIPGTGARMLPQLMIVDAWHQRRLRGPPPKIKKPPISIWRLFSGFP